MLQNDFLALCVGWMGTIKIGCSVQLTHKVMNKQEYIKKAEEILGITAGEKHGFNMQAERNKLEALYQLHIEGVREEKNRLLKNINMVNVYIDEKGHLKKVKREKLKK